MFFLGLPRAKSRGFSLIEILIVAFVVATIVVGVTGLAFIVTRTAVEAKRKSMAGSIANEEMEIARTYPYAQIEYTSAKPPGKIAPVKQVERNQQPYQVDSLITYVDDPRTPGSQDFKQLTVKVSWPRAAAPVVLSSYFTGRVREKPGDTCIPNTATCPDPSACDPTVESCLFPPPFLVCPESGRCRDIGAGDEDPLPTLPPASPGASCAPNQDCPAGHSCREGQCQPDWCEIIDSAPLIDVGACQGEFVIEGCTQTCPSWRRIGELGQVSICGRPAYCVITNYSFESCPDDSAICARNRERNPRNQPRD